jgi:ABC-2 type transport system ATP-binding protein
VTDPTGEPVIEAAGLRMRYGTKDVLNGLALRVERGEVLALLGPNGAGKTTTIEILEGFRQRSAGQALVLGVDPAHGDESWRARVGIVLQSWRDHGKWRVRQFLANQGSLYAPYGTPRAPRPWDVDGLLSAVGLTGQANEQVRRLSGGQRRRLDVAVGLVGRPELIFLDEPTAGLDPQARRDFHDLLRTVADDLGMTVLLTTHDLVEAEKLADRISVIVGGRVIADGTSEQLSQQIGGADRVRWVLGGRRHEQATADSTRFARELFRLHGDAISELEVHRASLEDTYLALVRAAEQSQVDGTAAKAAA